MLEVEQADLRLAYGHARFFEGGSDVRQDTDVVEQQRAPDREADRALGCQHRAVRAEEVVQRVDQQADKRQRDDQRNRDGKEDRNMPIAEDRTRQQKKDERRDRED